MVLGSLNWRYYWILFDIDASSHSEQTPPQTILESEQINVSFLCTFFSELRDMLVFKTGGNF